MAPEVPQDLTAEELEALLSELVVQYQEPSFQAALSRALAACAQHGLGLQAVLGPLVLQVQRPILERHGLPPNAQGVDLMKHAVHRRITEGAERVEELANEARRLLGIELIPSRSGTAEEKLAASADETARRFGSGDARAAACRREECRQILLAAARVVPAASSAYLQSLLEDDSVPIPSVLCMLRMARLGVPADALSGRRTTVESVAELSSPEYQEFFQGYVLPGNPAVLRGWVDGAKFSPMHDFIDFHFLRRRCGHRRVLVKSLGFKDEAGRPQFMSDPELKLPFVAFLDAVEEHERSGAPMLYYLGKVPLRTELPELAEAIAEAATDPQRCYGACFGEPIPEGVFTYFGCGRNTTTVHYDAHENLMLCVCGSKRVWLYPPSAARYVYPISKERAESIDFSRSAAIPFRKFDSLSPELQAKYPLLEHAVPLEVTVRPGDVLYLPSCWWHCVEGSEERNMILNWWFSLHPDKKALADTGGEGNLAAAAASESPGWQQA